MTTTARGRLLAAAAMVVCGLTWWLATAQLHHFGYYTMRALGLFGL